MGGGCKLTCQATCLEPGDDSPDSVRAFRVGRRRLLCVHGHALVKGQSGEAGRRPRRRLAWSGRAAEKRLIGHRIMAAVLQAVVREASVMSLQLSLHLDQVLAKPGFHWYRTLHMKQPSAA